MYVTLHVNNKFWYWQSLILPISTWTMSTTLRTTTYSTLTVSSSGCLLVRWSGGLYKLILFGIAGLMLILFPGYMIPIFCGHMYRLCVCHSLQYRTYLVYFVVPNLWFGGQTRFVRIFPCASVSTSSWKYALNSWLFYTCSCVGIFDAPRFNVGAVSGAAVLTEATIMTVSFIPASEHTSRWCCGRMCWLTFVRNCRTPCWSICREGSSRLEFCVTFASLDLDGPEYSKPSKSMNVIWIPECIPFNCYCCSNWNWHSPIEG